MATLVRRPLQPKNLNSLPLIEAPLKKPTKLNQKITTTRLFIPDDLSREICPIQSSVCKEDFNVSKEDFNVCKEDFNVCEETVKQEKQDDVLREVSLAEELEIVRKRKERLRMERQKTEEILKERDFVLENAMKEMERRAEEQNNIELEIYKIILLKDLRTSSMRVYPVQSLRMKEEEKKTRELSEGVSSVKSLRQKEEEKKIRNTQSEESSSARLKDEDPQAQDKGKEVAT